MSGLDSVSRSQVSSTYGPEPPWAPLQHLQRRRRRPSPCLSPHILLPLFDAELPCERSGSHLMIGPDARGRFWTIAIDYLSDGQAMPVTAWPSKRSQIKRYEEEE